MSLASLRKSLRAAARPGDAAFLQRFFKTGPGEYAEGDKFLGVRVPPVRRLVRGSDSLAEANIISLVESPYHEERLLGLLIWVRRYEKAGEPGRSAIYQAYLARTAFINNWDLVDSSAPQIVGAWLLEHPRDRRILHNLSASGLLWDRRIAMLATFAFIRAGEYTVATDIATRLIHDPHDLIHKAVGWMLREAGQRDLEVLRSFLETHAATMPRTALRYAIEKLPPAERAQWLGRKAG